MSKFYQTLCGFEEEHRADAHIGGRPIREVHFRSDPPGTGIFTLTKFLDAKRPATQALILGFITSDIDRFVARSIAAGEPSWRPCRQIPNTASRSPSFAISKEI
jgi:hypothetical protein